MGYFSELQIKLQEATEFKALCPRCGVWNTKIALQDIRTKPKIKCFNCDKELTEFNPVVEG